MAAGLQVWDANGNLTFNTSDYLFRFLGIIEIGTSNGERYDQNLSYGEGFVIFKGSNPNYQPNVYIDGNYVRWNYTYTSGSATGTVIYGIK